MRHKMRELYTLDPLVIGAEMLLQIGRRPYQSIKVSSLRMRATGYQLSLRSQTACSNNVMVKTSTLPGCGETASFKTYAGIT